VSPRVRYEMTCLLIRDAMGSVPCSDECEIDVVTRLGSHGARGAVVPRTTLKNLSIAMVPRTTLSKPGIRPIETFVTASSDLCAIHQRKCKNGKRRFL
jgi:hypothetical protein